MYDGSGKVAYIDNYYNPVADNAQADCCGKRIVYFIVATLIHVWLLKLLSGDKFAETFNSLVFYGQHIISKDWQSFMEANFTEANSIKIIYSFVAFIVFCEITRVKLDKLEETAQKTKEVGFKLILAELAIVHLIVLIMRFIYPWILHLFNNIDEIFSYEIAHFIIAESVIYIACTVFYLQDLLENMFSTESVTHYDERVGLQNQKNN